MLEGIESMRQLYEEIRLLKEYTDIETDELEKIADAIEREVEERYIELPKDADGEYIHMNDEMESVYEGDVFIVKRLKYSEKHGWMIGGACKHDLSEYRLYASKKCRHRKPPTVEDVLREFAERWGDMSYGSDEERELFAEYAQKLRLANNEE